MTTPQPGKLQRRVEQAAKAVLARQGSVGPLELFQEMQLLAPSHVEGWRHGNESYQVLEKWIQVGPGKFQQILRHWETWVATHGLQPMEAAHSRQGPSGIENLQVTETGDPAREKFYRTQYVPANLTQQKAARLKTKLNRPPDLVVFQKVSAEGKCSECGTDLFQGDFLLMEKGQPLCLACADLDHLVFLQSGDMALTRRARKHSPLSAVVVRFSRARKRYERQGLLVAEEALARAESECAADAPKRARSRERAALVRAQEDLEFVAALSEAILKRYPACPAAEACRIAEHTGLRHSGRVGRSAAGRALDNAAVDLAVIAHIRHEHTKYDELLMGGIERLDARIQVRETIDEVLVRWLGRNQPGNH